jgi:hypothetical protein
MPPVRAPFASLTADERRLFRRLDTPRRIQDYLERIPVNFERHGETCKSPRRVLRTGSAHCLEGAMLAAAALWFHGARPLLLDLKATARDVDHVVTPFRARGRWGAISKTNHSVLRYRDPVYRTVRELAMSYFHEYTIKNGLKTLASYSAAFDLRRLGGGWVTDPKPQWDLQYALDVSRHWPILPDHVRSALRRADVIERRASGLMQWSSTGEPLASDRPMARIPGTGSTSRAR